MQRKTLLRRLLTALVAMAVALPVVLGGGWWLCYSYIDGAYQYASLPDGTRQRVRSRAGLLLRERAVSASALPAYFGQGDPAALYFEYTLLGPFRFIVQYDGTEQVVQTFPVYE